MRDGSLALFHLVEHFVHYIALYKRLLFLQLVKSASPLRLVGSVAL
jgi:hypothetical protein